MPVPLAPLDAASPGTGRNVRSARHNAGLSVRELSARSGISQNAIRACELGHRRPAARTLRRLARALHVPPADLDPELTVPVSHLDRVRLSAYLDAAGPSGLTRSRLYRLTHNHLTKAQLDHLLAELLNTGRYEHLRVPTSRKPAHVYRRTVPGADTPL